jgi:hypothetical protein
VEEASREVGVAAQIPVKRHPPLRVSRPWTTRLPLMASRTSR